jgi:hypothetical protein
LAEIAIGFTGAVFVGFIDFLLREVKSPLIDIADAQHRDIRHLQEGVEID